MWLGTHRSLCLPNGVMMPPLPEGWSHADKLNRSAGKLELLWRCFLSASCHEAKFLSMTPEDMYAAMLDVQNLEEVRTKQLEVNRLLPGRAFMLRCFLLLRHMDEASQLRKVCISCASVCSWHPL